MPHDAANKRGLNCGWLREVSDNSFSLLFDAFSLREPGIHFA
jgi:hypothetical protein